MSAFNTLLKTLSSRNPLAGFGAQARGKFLPYDEQTILDNIRKNAPEILKRGEGFTFDPRRGVFLEPEKQLGSMMSSIPNDPSLLPVQAGAGVARNVQDLINISSKPEIMARLRRNEYLGGWGPNGELGLDPSKRFLTDASAIKSGLTTGQAAGFRTGRGQTYDVTDDALRDAKLKRDLLGSAVAGGSVTAADYLYDKEISELGGASGSVATMAGILSLLANAGPAKRGVKGAANLDFLTAGTAGATGKAIEKMSNSKLKKAVNKYGKSKTSKILKDVKAEGKGSTVPSAFANQITDDLQKQIKIIGKTPKGKDKLSLIPTENPDLLKYIGIKPVTGYDLEDPKSIKNLDKEFLNEELKSNIRRLLKLGGYDKFYTDMPDILKRLDKDGNLNDVNLLAGISAPYSATASVPSQLKITGKYLENPTLYPEGLRGSDAWIKSIRSTINENPLDPFNFNNEGNIIKVGSFARNLTNSAKFDKNVTADRHALKSALGILYDKIPDMSDPQIYNIFVRAFNEVGAELGLKGRQVQAEAWDIWRKLMIKDPGTTDLSKFVEPVKVNEIFKLTPQERKEYLKKEFIKQGRDSTFLRDAKLI